MTHYKLFILCLYTTLSSLVSQAQNNQNQLLKSHLVYDVQGADLDNDGDVDLVVRSQTVLILINQGNNTFDPIDLNLTILKFHLTDITNDGLIDIVYKTGSNFNNTIKSGFILNEGNGNYSSANEIVSDAYLFEMETTRFAEDIGLINNDEYPDLFIRYSGYSSGYYLGSAAGFTNEFVPIGHYNNVLSVFDYDDDGLKDIIALDPFVLDANWMGPNGFYSITCVKNNGDGTFFGGNIELIANTPQTFYNSLFDFVDVNFDQKKEFLIQNLDSIYVYTQPLPGQNFVLIGQTVFQPALNTYIGGLSNLGEPWLDLANNWNTYKSFLGVDLFNNNISGRCFDQYETDINGNATIKIYYGSLFEAGNQIEPTVIYDVPWYGQFAEILNTPVSVFDLNGDGLKDIFIGLNGLSVLYQLPNQTFDQPTSILKALDFSGIGESFPGAQIADLNGDGMQDIIARSRNNFLMAYINQGNNEYSIVEELISLPEISAPDNISLGRIGWKLFHVDDFNSDGLSDIIVLKDESFLSTSFTFYRYKNLGNLQFELIGTWVLNDLNSYNSAFPDRGRLQSINLNDDGIDDLVFYANADLDSWYALISIDEFGIGTVENLYTDANGTLEHWPPYYFEDFDNDGKTDIITFRIAEFSMGNEEDFTFQYWPNVNGTFPNFIDLDITTIFPGTLTIADLNGDELQDIVQNGAGIETKIYYQTSPLNFEMLVIDYDLPLLGVLDVNQDQLPDLIYDNKVLAASPDGGFSTEILTDYFSQFQEDLTFAPQENLYYCCSGNPLGLQYLQQINANTEPFAKFLGRDKHTSWLNISTIDIESAVSNPLSTVNVQVFMDFNENNIPDEGESILTNFPVVFDGEITQYTSLTTGQTARLLNEGNHTISVSIDPELWAFTETGNIEYIVDDNTPSFQYIYFGIHPNGIIHRLEATVNVSPTICSTESAIEVQVINTGNQSSSGIIYTVIDPEMMITSIIPEPAYQIQDTIFWELTAMSPGSLSSFEIVAGNPNFESIGDTILSSVWASYLDDGNNILASDTSYSDQILLCAYDPNDITEHTGIGEEGIIDAGQQLDFTVRFQNTGNAPATDVRVEQTLSSLLDKGTLVPIAWSDPFTLNIDADGRAVFFFENIMLPDSTSDEPGSHGFIRYHIDALPDLSPGTVINSTAEIFFDFNPAVVTNSEVNTIFTPTIGIESLNIQHGIFVYPNPTNNFIKIMVPSNQIGNKLSIYNVMGQRVINDTLVTSTQSTLDLSGLSKGVYVLSIGSERKTIVKE